MDFASVELSTEDKEFRDRLRAFLTVHVTDEVRRRDRETGENFDEGVHLALGAEGYLAADWKDESDGGFSALRRRIWDLEIGRVAHPVVPLGHHRRSGSEGAAVRIRRAGR